MNSQEDNIKRCQMSLLYLQTKEVNLLYSKNIVCEKDYYLVDKEWLNKFMQSNYYNDAVEQFKNIEDVNYDNLKEKLCNNYQIDKNQLIYNFENISENQEYLCKRKPFEKDNINVSYPIKFQLVKQELFAYNPEGSLDDCPLYKIIIGNQSIVIIDNRQDNVAFVYSKFKNEFQIKGILVYDDQEVLQKEMSKLIYFNSYDKYLINRKLDQTKKEIQKIVDREDEEWGFFCSLIEIVYYKKNQSIDIVKEIIKQSNIENNKSENLQNNIKQILGAADYDAFVIAKNDSRVFVGVELMHSGLCSIPELNIETMCIAEFLSKESCSIDQLFKYIYKMIELRFMVPFTASSLIRIAEYCEGQSDEIKKDVLEKWKRIIEYCDDDDEYTELIIHHLRKEIAFVKTKLNDLKSIYIELLLVLLKASDRELRYSLNTEKQIHVEIVKVDEKNTDVAHQE